VANFLSKKGQAGSVFKLLIGAVIGLAIIGIIYSIIAQIDNQKTYLNEEVFSNKIIMGMKNPTGTDYFIDNFNFEKNKVLNKKALSDQTGLAERCITLINSSGENNSNIETSDSYFKFNNDIVLDVGINCSVGEDDCQIDCALTLYNQGKYR